MNARWELASAARPGPRTRRQPAAAPAMGAPHRGQEAARDR